MSEVSRSEEFRARIRQHGRKAVYLEEMLRLRMFAIAAGYETPRTATS